MAGRQEFSLNLGLAAPLSSVNFHPIGGGSQNNGDVGPLVGLQYLYFPTSRLGLGCEFSYFHRDGVDSHDLLPNSHTDVYGDTLLFLAMMKYSLIARGERAPLYRGGRRRAPCTSTVVTRLPAAASPGRTRGPEDPGAWSTTTPGPSLRPEDWGWILTCSDRLSSAWRPAGSAWGAPNYRPRGRTRPWVGRHIGPDQCVHFFGAVGLAILNVRRIAPGGALVEHFILVALAASLDGHAVPRRPLGALRPLHGRRAGSRRAQAPPGAVSSAAPFLARHVLHAPIPPA